MLLDFFSQHVTHQFGKNSRTVQIKLSKFLEIGHGEKESERNQELRKEAKRLHQKVQGLP
jgi:hypothetical protein